MVDKDPNPQLTPLERAQAQARELQAQIDSALQGNPTFTKTVAEWIVKRLEVDVALYEEIARRADAGDPRKDEYAKLAQVVRKQILVMSSSKMRFLSTN